MIKLYGSAHSRAARCLWMLEELEQAYEHLDLEDLDAAATLQTVTRVNPIGKVPALEDGEVKLFESMAINLYLAAKYGSPSGHPMRRTGASRGMEHLGNDRDGAAPGAIIPRAGDQKRRPARSAKRSTCFGHPEATAKCIRTVPGWHAILIGRTVQRSRSESRVCPDTDQPGELRFASLSIYQTMASSLLRSSCLSKNLSGPGVCTVESIPTTKAPQRSHIIVKGRERPVGAASCRDRCATDISTAQTPSCYKCT